MENEKWNEETFSQIAKRIDSYYSEAVFLQKELIKRPAISPSSGGKGEFQKARFLIEYLSSLRLGEIEIIEAPDERAENGVRPSIVLRRNPTTLTRTPSPTCWIMSHLDVVPAGPRKNWDTDPFEGVVKDGKIYGRGSEDNNQGLIASILALKAIVEEKISLQHPVGLLFIADEETGSEYGIAYILKHKNPFAKDDIIVVPDAGTPDGTAIEVAEKSILWLKLTIQGKQGHGSRPDTAINAHRAAANLTVRLDDSLRKRYPQKNELFHPPVSTFEPTKKEANVENVNTIPAEDILYFDCRILPATPVDEVLKTVEEISTSVERDFGVKVNISLVQRADAAPPTPPDSPVVKALSSAIRRVYGKESHPVGIGGGTVAAFVRRAGLHAAVWAKINEKAHQPNEYCEISNLLGDAKVFAHLFGRSL
ncbi:MAG: M20 family metallo-hydrolase [Planctomycetota bacterium]|nr:M20 family metallo-hydrolase [Planctomycetota bacterium]